MSVVTEGQAGGQSSWKVVSIRRPAAATLLGCPCDSAFPRVHWSLFSSSGPSLRVIVAVGND